MGRLRILNHTGGTIAGYFNSNFRQVKPITDIQDQKQLIYDFDSKIYRNVINVQFGKGGNTETGYLDYNPVLNSTVLVQMAGDKKNFVITRIHEELSNGVFKLFQEKTEEITVVHGYEYVGAQYPEREAPNTVEVKRILVGITDNEVVQYLKKNATMDQDNLDYALQKHKTLGGVRFLWGFLSLCAGKSYEEGYNRQLLRMNDQQWRTKGYYTQLLFSLPEHKIQASGSLSVVGQKKPSSPQSVYIETLEIQTKNGSKKIYCGASPKICTDRGVESKNVEGSLTLKILPQ